MGSPAPRSCRGRPGAESAPGQASLGWGAGARAGPWGQEPGKSGRGPADAGGLEGKGLKNTQEKGGAPATQGRGLPGEKRPERKRSAEGQERGPARGAPPGVGLG